MVGKNVRAKQIMSQIKENGKNRILSVLAETRPPDSAQQERANEKIELAISLGFKLSPEKLQRFRENKLSANELSGLKKVAEGFIHSTQSCMQI